VANYSNRAVNAKADALLALAAGGKLRLYTSGTPGQPATADTALTDQVRLAELTLGTPAFGAAVAGVATAAPITADPSAAATGVATWFRVVQSDGVTSLFDGTVGTAGTDLVLNSASIQVGAEVSVTSLVYTERKA
jgi:hypothetical protein